jgi:diguanylate cyclase (GGDEF)-like protein/PAS domain S-box-containing protein
LLRAVGRRAGRRRHDRIGKSASRALNMISTPAVTLAATGQIIATNDAWDLDARERGGKPSTTGVGANYLTVCRQAVGEFSYGALDVGEGISAVLSGERESFAFDYPCPEDGDDRWFNVRAVPLDREGGGAVVTHVDVTEIRGAEEEIRRRQSLLRTSNVVAFSSFHDHEAEIFALVDAEGTVLHLSESTVRLLGNARLNSVSNQLLGRVDPLDLERAAEVFLRVVSSPASSEAFVVRVIDRIGRQRTLDLTVTNLLNDPAVHALAVSGADVTDSRFEQIAGRIESKLLEMLPASVVVTDYSGTVVYWNQRASSLYGYSASDAVGRTIKELRIRPGTETTIDAVVMMSGRWEGDIVAARADGSSVSVHAIIERIEAPDIDFEGIVSSSIDISERRELEEMLLHQTRHDPVTGLPNRRRLNEFVEEALRSKESGGEPFAVFHVDFDGFRSVNERFGHLFGDETLRAWAAQVATLLSPGDFLAHLGEDEFVICRMSVRSRADALAFAGQVQDVAAGAMVVGVQRVAFTASIGVAFSSRNTTAEALLRNSGVAMFTAKDLGSSRIELFDEAHHEEVRNRNALRLELAKAVDRDEIDAFFQPEVSLTTGEIVGFEALARWRQHRKVAIDPAEFIPLAEESGLIGKIGAMMLEASCRGILAWEEISPGRRFTVAVNVSVLQLMDPKFPDSVREICSRFGVDPSRICLEVTESVLADELLAFHALHELKAVGVLIALDDFGTGYSSLLRLNRYPLDFLKIDRSFVSELNMAKREPVVIAAMLGIASALNFRMIGEGIEGELQWRRLREMGCELGQGYLFSEAVTLEAATALIKSDVRFSPPAA